MRNRRAVRVDEDGNLVIPQEFRRRHGLERDAKVVVESTADGLFLRPVSSLSRHTYSDERRAEFLLSNATNEEDYRQAVETVRSMGLNPEQVSHERPAKSGCKRALA